MVYSFRKDITVNWTQQTRLEFELGSPTPLSTPITITLPAHPLSVRCLQKFLVQNRFQLYIQSVSLKKKEGGRLLQITVIVRGELVRSIDYNWGYEISWSYVHRTNFCSLRKIFDTFWTLMFFLWCPSLWINFLSFCFDLSRNYRLSRLLCWRKANQMTLKYKRAHLILWQMISCWAVSVV